MKQKTKSKLSKAMTLAELDDFLQKVYDGEITDVDPELVESVRSVYDNEYISENLYMKCKELIALTEKEVPSPNAEFSPELLKRGVKKVGELYRVGLEVFEAASAFNDHIRESYPDVVIESGFELKD